jgi:hypothetical protein
MAVLSGLTIFNTLKTITKFEPGQSCGDRDDAARSATVQGYWPLGVRGIQGKRPKSAPSDRDGGKSASPAMRDTRTTISCSRTCIDETQARPLRVKAATDLGSLVAILVADADDHLQRRRGSIPTRLWALRSDLIEPITCVNCGRDVTRPAMAISPCHPGGIDVVYQRGAERRRSCLGRKISTSPKSKKGDSERSRYQVSRLDAGEH